MAADTTPGSPRAYQVTVGDESAGQRIDNFLITKLKGVPKTRIYRIVRKGEVRVNKGRIKPGYRLREGDVVRIPPVRVAERSTISLQPAPALAARLNKAVLHEDSRLLVINKPSGVAVHGGSGISHGIIETLRAARPDAHFLELVHRLDRDTSGCLIIAKKRSTLRILHELLRGDGVDKRYLALVQGVWQGGKQQVDAPLRKNQLSSGERIVRVDPQGKSALTLFKPVQIYKQATLVEVKLLTGRTHQIRVHAAHIGHPIAGDEKYGNMEFNKSMRIQGLSRLFLHAASLRFKLSAEEAAIQINAPLQDELQHLLARLNN